jgi:signal peptidase
MKIVQNIIGKIVNLLIIIVIVAIIFCLYCVFSIKVLHKQYINLFGYSIFEVASGSMQKTINVGDAVLIKLNSGNYKKGDIVTYQNGNDYITHRIVTVENDYVITKGDNNNVNDNPIDKKLVVGKVVKVLPRLGIWKKVLLTPKVIVLVLVTLFIFSFMFSYDGKAIKIISSSKAQKEIDVLVNEEVNKKMQAMKRRRRSKRVLEATQIIDVNEIRKQLYKEEKAKRKLQQRQTNKKLEATQIIDVNEIKRELTKREIDELVNREVNRRLQEMKRRKRNKMVLETTQVIDVDEIKKALDEESKITSTKKKKLDVSPIMEVNEIKKRVGSNGKI